ncbi:hypothetical protein AbraIFM66950_011530 [Aspergillus brasiliensis]|nr:hypothetical protein AbraIFM66950_011530 [Aspergillus brasiliensis]
MATALDARALTRSPIPDLLVGLSTTSTVTTHNLEYKAGLVHWNTFEKEVRQVFDSTQWNQQREILAYAPANSRASPNNTWNEQLFCGDEYSVLARFGQNVGHVMTSVFQSLGVSARFGDFKACTGSSIVNKVPDVALLTGSGGLRIVGEAKTPWKHDLRAAFQDQYQLRHILGQLARYMHEAKIKYGFLTTYKQTIFLKQAPHPDKQKRGQMALWHSNVISHNTPSAEVDPRGDFTRYKGRVSLRECFLFLGKMANDSPMCENPLDSTKWVAAPNTKVWSDSDHISPSVSSSEDGSDGERGRSRPPPPPPAAGQSQHWQSHRPPAQPPSNATSQSRSQSRSSAAATHQLALRPRDSQRQPQQPAPTALSAASQSRSQSRPPAPSTYQVMGQAQASQPRNLAPTAPSAASQSRSRSRPPAPSTQQVMRQSQASSVHSQSQAQSRPVTRSQTQGQSKAATTTPSNEHVETVYDDGAGNYYYVDTRGVKHDVDLKRDITGRRYFKKGDKRQYVNVQRLK